MAAIPLSPVLRQGHTALVTGASSGIGAEFAAQLAGRGLDLILIARRADRLEQLAAHLRNSAGVAVETIALDLAAPGAPQSLHERVGGSARTVDLVVNNAGSGTVGDVVDADPAAIDAVIAVNVTALTGLSRLFAADMAARGRGAILNVASLAALLPAPHMAVYAATKSYVQSFTQALDAELRPAGACALTLLPGPTRTEFFDASGGRIGPESAYLAPAAVVSAALRALDRPNPASVIVPGRGNAVAAPVMARLPRRLGLSISEKMMRMGMDMSSPASPPTSR